MTLEDLTRFLIDLQHGTPATGGHA
jgi:hypothetical protein